MSDCDPTDCSLPGSAVYAILQARIMEWLAIPSPEDLPNPGIKPGSPALQADSLPAELPGNSLQGMEVPAMWETLVQSLGWEDPLEKETATHSSILAWRRTLVGYSPWGHKESDTTERLHFHFQSYLI